MKLSDVAGQGYKKINGMQVVSHKNEGSMYEDEQC